MAGGGWDYYFGSRIDFASGEKIQTSLNHV
jgi:hypothetical protein